ncbi:unnamed protein product [Larinioides sclopetarius]|uniref:Ionotropic glutamate receptor C-terminal domain-containing protein n=1 Tax=Larinioides sclopetarius TaxID=280406 RepID=A0AAV2B4W6_9ARAC
MLMAAWWMTCLLLAAFYTANLTAFMTTETSITDRSIEELIHSGRKWIFRKGTAFSDYLFKESIDEHEKDFSLLKKSFINGNGMMIDSDDEVIDFLRKGYAYIQEVNVLNYMLFEDSMETNGSCPFNAIDLHFFEHTTAFAFPKGSLYAIPFSEYIEFLRKIGLVQKWMQQYLLSTDVCAFHFDNKLSRKEKALTIYEFHTAFYILCMGAILGLLCLFIELRKTVFNLFIETRGRVFKIIIKILFRIIKSMNRYNQPRKTVLIKRRKRI